MPPKNTYRVEKKKWLADSHLSARVKATANYENVLKALLEDVEDEGGIESVRSSCLTFEEVQAMFSLANTEDNMPLWEAPKQIYEVPQLLKQFQSCLKKANYRRDTEAYSRLPIDFLIMTAAAHHKDLLDESFKVEAAATQAQQSKAPTADQSVTIQSADVDLPDACTIQPRTPQKKNKPGIPPFPLQVRPEFPLTVKVRNGDQVTRITGIADWVIGYGEKDSLADASVLMAVEAKRGDEYLTAKPQLLAYLATIRQLRIQANKSNVAAQGFYSNGELFRFMGIRNNGTIVQSRNYDTIDPAELKIVYNFLLNMQINAARSSPNTSPTKPGEEQEEDIRNFDRNVFVELIEEPGTGNDDIAEEEEVPELVIQPRQ